MAAVFLIISLSSTNVNALCVGDGCRIMGATMFTYFVCWPIYLVWIILALFDFSVPTHKFGMIVGIITSIWIYDSTVNLDRIDMIFLPISHLIFALIMYLLHYRLKKKNTTILDI